MNLDTTGIQESVLTHCSTAFSGAKIKYNSSSVVESAQLQLGVLTKLAGELPMLQHKPGSLSHSTKTEDPLNW